MDLEKLEGAVQEALGLRTYTVKCFWDSSDSFTDEDHPPINYSDLIEVKWKSRALAEQAAKRIEAHSIWYHSLNFYSTQSLPRPTWLFPLNKENSIRDVVSSIPRNKLISDFELNVTLDNGTEQIIHADWVGYFERLWDVQVVELVYDPATKEYVEKDPRDE